MTAGPRVVVTGAAGLIGSILRERLPARDDGWIGPGTPDTSEAADVMLQMLNALDRQEGVHTGNRLHHSLRAATLAEQAGADDHLVVAALCHDIGATLRGRWHGRLSAQILAPYVRPEVSWAVAVHEDFIARYRRRGLRRYARYRHVLRRHYRLARRFVDEWDAPAQRDGIAFRPLSHFEPIVHRVVATPRPGRSRRRRMLDLLASWLPRPVARPLERSVRERRRASAV